MGEVYLARSVGAAGFQKHVVIKKILPHLTEHPSTVESLVREAKLLVRLDHPNVVQVLDLGVEGSDYFMAMEYVHGYNLSTILHYCSKHTVVVPAPVCAYIAIEVLRALAYAHELRGGDGRRHNIIHRDVSPQNVMISASGQVKLTDFGIAKVLSGAGDELTQSLKGKWRYMAPEAVLGGRIDHRYDLFAVGILLFESLTRRNLFSGKRDVDILNRVREAKVPDIHKYHPDVPEPLVEVTLRALAKDPDERFQSARDLAQALVNAILPVPESQAEEQLSAFVGRLYEAEGFPVDKPKILDPNCEPSGSGDTTRSLMLKSSIDERAPDSARRRRPSNAAILLLSVGLVALSAVVAYIAYAVLMKDEGRSSTNGVIIIDERKDGGASPPAADLSPPPAADAARPDSGRRKPRLPAARPFDKAIGRRVFARTQRRLQRCMLRHGPKGVRSVKLVVVSDIRRDGKVTEVRIQPPEVASSKLGQCVRDIARRVRYPRHTLPSVTYTQPLNLRTLGP